MRAGPETVARCLLDYDTALCGYLGVARNPPPSSLRTKVSCHVCTSVNHSAFHNIQKGKVASRVKAGSKKSKKTTPTDPAPKPSVAGIVEEVVVRGGAVRFYVVGVPETESDSIGVFLTQNEGIYSPLLSQPLLSLGHYSPPESEGAPHGIANQALPLSREKYTRARARSVVLTALLQLFSSYVHGRCVCLPAV